MVRARNVKFGKQIDHRRYWRKKRKIRSQGVGKGSRDQLLKFWDPFHISGTVELETPNFACRFITRGTNERNAKLGQKGSGRGHVTYFCNFGTPSISRKRLELETSNLACRFITRDANERIAKLGQKWPGRGHVIYERNVKSGQKGLGRVTWPTFEILGLPSSRELLELETSNLARRFITSGTNDKNAKLGQKGSEGVMWPAFEILAQLHISGTK